MDTIDVYAHYANEGDYPDLDYLSAERHLSAALRCRTVWAGEKTDLSQFAALHGLIRDAYPNLMNHATFELVGQSVLLTLPGTDSSLEPAMLIAHQDVVPVVAGTEGQWELDPFSGKIDDEWIWGRGALDIKDMLVAELEAVEHLLARGERPDASSRTSASARRATPTYASRPAARAATPPTPLAGHPWSAFAAPSPGSATQSRHRSSPTS